MMPDTFGRSMTQAIRTAKTEHGVRESLRLGLEIFTGAGTKTKRRWNAAAEARIREIKENGEKT